MVSGWGVSFCDGVGDGWVSLPGRRSMVLDFVLLFFLKWTRGFRRVGKEVVSGQAGSSLIPRSMEGSCFCLQRGRRGPVIFRDSDRSVRKV